MEIHIEKLVLNILLRELSDIKVYYDTALLGGKEGFRKNRQLFKHWMMYVYFFHFTLCSLCYMYYITDAVWCENIIYQSSLSKQSVATLNVCAHAFCLQNRYGSWTRHWLILFLQVVHAIGQEDEILCKRQQINNNIKYLHESWSLIYSLFVTVKK